MRCACPRQVSANSNVEYTFQKCTRLLQQKQILLAAPPPINLPWILYDVLLGHRSIVHQHHLPTRAFHRKVHPSQARHSVADSYDNSDMPDEAEMRDGIAQGRDLLRRFLEEEVPDDDAKTEKVGPQGHRTHSALPTPGTFPRCTD